MANTEVEIAELEEKLKQADIKSDPDTMDELIADDALLTGHEETCLPSRMSSTLTGRLGRRSSAAST